MESTVIRQVYDSVCRGFLDSIAVHRCLVLVVRSEKVRTRLIQCFILNGVIFLGSIIVFQQVVGPFLRWGLSSLFNLEPSEDSIGSIQKWIEWIYLFLWIVPMYIVSFVLNTLWHQDIARESMKVFFSSSSSAARESPVSSSISNEIVQVIFRSVFNLMFLLYLCVLYRWKWVYTVHLGWLIAYNSFEYRWIADKLTFDEKILLFERNYIYYLCFGLSLSLISVQFPAIVENGLISLSLPLLIMSASTAAKPPTVSVPDSLPWLDRKLLSWLQRIPVLIFPEWLTKILIIGTNWLNQEKKLSS